MELAKVMDSAGSTYLTKSMKFACGNGTLEDIKKKVTNKSKNAKGYKIPRSMLKPELLQKIDYGNSWC